MSILRVVLILLAVALAGLIVWASANANMFESFGPIIADPWGLVAIADLYLSFVVIAVLVWIFEPDLRFRFLAIIPLFFLGSPWIVIWLVFRLPYLIGLKHRG